MHRRILDLGPFTQISSISKMVEVKEGGPETSPIACLPPSPGPRISSVLSLTQACGRRHSSAADSQCPRLPQLTSFCQSQSSPSQEPFIDPITTPFFGLRNKWAAGYSADVGRIFIINKIIGKCADDWWSLQRNCNNITWSSYVS
mmetsp:Transcript_4672/g.7243  ORF Transcript_4672/g.7243 Transcript_4672/m.7243 type:complete len:145 (+) Transcript_4672:447-881(+)